VGLDVVRPPVLGADSAGSATAVAPVALTARVASWPPDGPDLPFPLEPELALAPCSRATGCGALGAAACRTGSGAGTWATETGAAAAGGAGGEAGGVEGRDGSEPGAAADPGAAEAVVEDGAREPLRLTTGTLPTLGGATGATGRGESAATRPAVATPGAALKGVELVTNSAVRRPSGRAPSTRGVSGSSGLTPGPLGEGAAISIDGRGEPVQSGHRSKEPMPPPVTPAPAKIPPTAAIAAAAPATTVILLFGLSVISLSLSLRAIPATVTAYGVGGRV